MTSESRIDWQPLLGRPLRAVDDALVSAAVAQKRILVTGAGGSIGSALALRAARAGHAGLVLLDSSEQSLYELDREISGHADSVELVLGNAGDRNLLRAIFRDHCPQIVFHAAAFKHVPLMEQNPFAVVSNNVLTTDVLLDAAESSPSCEQFVLVSTDKAVVPCGLMGASKRIAELLLLAPTQQRRTLLRKTVRLFNVLGSSGSVVPRFLDQIERNLPLTVTHPEAKRFFMSTGDSVAALLSAVLVPRSAFLIPEPGEPIRILDLARYLCAWAAAHHPRRSEPEIVFTALRPGEKMQEVLLSDRESWSSALELECVAPLFAMSLRQVISPAEPAVQTAVTSLRSAVESRDLARLLGTVCALVPEYTPSPTLVSRMQRIARDEQAIDTEMAYSYPGNSREQD